MEGVVGGPASSRVEHWALGVSREGMLTWQSLYVLVGITASLFGPSAQTIVPNPASMAQTVTVIQA